MTDDSKLFPPLEKWEAKGYRPDAVWPMDRADGDVASAALRRGDDRPFHVSQRAG